MPPKSPPVAKVSPHRRGVEFSESSDDESNHKPEVNRDSPIASWNSSNRVVYTGGSVLFVSVVCFLLLCFICYRLPIEEVYKTENEKIVQNTNSIKESVEALKYEANHMKNCTISIRESLQALKDEINTISDNIKLYETPTTELMKWIWMVVIAESAIILLLFSLKSTGQHVHVSHEVGQQTDPPGKNETASLGTQSVKILHEQETQDPYNGYLGHNKLHCHINYPLMNTLPKWTIHRSNSLPSLRYSTSRNMSSSDSETELKLTKEQEILNTHGLRNVTESLHNSEQGSRRRKINETSLSGVTSVSRNSRKRGNTTINITASSVYLNTNHLPN